MHVAGSRSLNIFTYLIFFNDLQLHIITQVMSGSLSSPIKRRKRGVSLLLCGDADRRVVAFRNAGVVCLEWDEENVWHLNWAFTPDLLALK